MQTERTCSRESVFVWNTIFFFYKWFPALWSCCPAILGPVGLRAQQEHTSQRGEVLTTKADLTEPNGLYCLLIIMPRTRTSSSGDSGTFENMYAALFNPECKLKKEKNAWTQPLGNWSGLQIINASRLLPLNVRFRLAVQGILAATTHISSTG